MKKQPEPTKPIACRCDCCDRLTDDLGIFEHGTLFGRPMMVCAACEEFLAQKEQIEEAAAQLDLGGVGEHTAPGIGLEMVRRLEEEYAERQRRSEIERLAICRLRFHFMRKIAANQ